MPAATARPLDHVVFVYGTLTEREHVSTVLESCPFEYCGNATLHGLSRVDGEYPTLVPGGRTTGRLLAIDRTGLDALDAYEGVDRGLYVRVAVDVSHPDVASDEGWCYVGDPDRLDAPGGWPGSGAFDTRVRAYLADASVIIGPEATSPN